MTSRTTKIVVVAALAAGGTVAGVGLTTLGSSSPGPVLQIDENRGLVGTVALGETRERMVGALGKPLLTRVTSRTTLVVYRHVVVELRAGKVFLIETDDPSARTKNGVRVGDPISAIRATYRKAATCNPNSPDKTAAHPHCTVIVPAGRMLINGDPIGLITLTTKS